MSHNLNTLCSEFITKVQSESDFITKQIDASYKENTDKETLEDIYQEQIDDFMSKYRNTFAGIINSDTNEVVGLDKECSDKLDTIVSNLKNYITDLGE
ncbi:hypothetical protein [Yeosuana sp.]|uniref:hypothetical protein n=1 Tax=Yeosuana sp. TaxID=2529388 RepID=UPI00404A253A